MWKHYRMAILYGVTAALSALLGVYVSLTWIVEPWPSRELLRTKVQEYFTLQEEESLRAERVKKFEALKDPVKEWQVLNAEDEKRLLDIRLRMSELVRERSVIETQLMASEEKR